MFGVKCCRDIRGEFFNCWAVIMSGEANVSIHVIVAQVGHPVQGRFAPATPVAFGNP